MTWVLRSSEGYVCDYTWGREGIEDPCFSPDPKDAVGFDYEDAAREGDWLEVVDYDTIN